MDKELQELKKFLEEQVEWRKKQDNILEKIENKLYEMKELAEYARDQELTSMEATKLNDQLNKLKQEVHSLEKLLQSEVN